MLLQNTLDLSTFEIVRFRIWNQTSQPSDRGFGSKYFNTNSGHEAYCREEIFTPIGWRTAAYMDDIDKINEKLDLIFGDELDTDTIIDSWKEVQDFLSGIEDTKNLMTMLDGKAEWNKNISSDSFKAIGYGTTGANGWKFNGPALSFGANSTYYAQLQINHQADQIVFRRHTTEGFSNWVSILHKNNFESIIENTYLKTDGSNIMARNAYVAWNSGDDGNDISDWSTVTGNGLRIISSSAENTGAPTPYATALHVRGRYYFKLASRGGSFDELYYQNSNHDWKTIAFTDSDITGNAATATALKNKVSLWGNEFDGTQGVNDNIYMLNGDALYFVTTSNEYISCVNMASDNVLTLGNGTNYSTRTLNTRLDGYNIYFRTGAKQTAMTITKEGRVLINCLSAICDRQLSIKTGGVYVGATLKESPVLGSVGSNSVLVGATTYGMQHWVLGNGQGHIQAGRFDGNATAYALNLNPLGGAVNVGEGGLNVAGAINANKGILVKGGGAFFNADAEGVYISTGNTIAWHDDDNSYVKDLLTFTQEDLVSHVNIRPYPSNSYSLGTSSYRWSNVYSVGGNFSGRVLIGGAADNENYKLITNGAIKIGRSNDPSTYLDITVSDILTKFDAIDSSDNYMHYSFQSHGTELLHLDGRANGTSYFRTLVGFDKLATFNGGALIPTGQTLTIGSVTFRETAEGEVEVDGNLHTTGTLASGGKGEVGENTTGNAMVYQYDLASGESVYTVDNVKGSTNVIVQIFEWNSNTSSWDMILTDVSVKADAITVTFGRTTTVNHMVTVC